jgi:hypothetical protein
MINANVKLLDAMDPSRIVEPIAEHGTSVTCKIWWRASRGNGLVYGGKAEVPAALFRPTLQNAEIGFLENYVP